MAKPKSEFLKAFGKAFEIFKRITDGVLALGGTDEDLSRLLTDADRVREIAEIIVRRPMVVPVDVRRLMDCDAQPFVPEGWRIESHRKSGQLEFDPAKIEFYLDEAQKTGTVVGNNLRKRLEHKSVLNACVLDFLLANTSLIPESWKVDEQGRTRYIFFWGTVYRRSNGNLYVRYLYWDDGEWRWDYYWLGNQWDARSQAAVSAS